MMKKFSFLIILTFIFSCLNNIPLYAADGITLLGDAEFSISSGKFDSRSITVKNNSSEAAKNVTLNIYTSGLSVVALDERPFEIAPGDRKSVV